MKMKTAQNLNEEIASRARKRFFSFATKTLRAITTQPEVQRIYEEYIWSQIRSGPIPEHIGIILDGNRRWAKSRGLAPWKGHVEGARKIEDFLDWCSEIDQIHSVTLYAFSTENFNRPAKEVSEIFRLLKDYLEELYTDERIVKNEVRLKMLGRISMLPQELQDLVKKLETKTKNFNKNFFNFAIAYGGRTEIVDAVKCIAGKVKENKMSLDDINEKVLEGFLYTAHLPKSSPDLIIRTSGEIRLSNFLTWQGAYSELCFVDVYWPDFRKLDLFRAIRMFQKRQRRFGE